MAVPTGNDRSEVMVPPACVVACGRSATVAALPHAHPALCVVKTHCVYEFYCKRGSFPHHQVARIPLRPPPLHRRRRARVVRCDVPRYHLECISALLQARINGDGLSPARVQLSHQNEQHGLHTITSIALTVRELASSLSRSLTYAAAIRCQASYEMEKTPVSDRPIDRCFRVAYDTPSSTHPKE